MSELFARHDLPEPPEEVICDALTAALRSRIAELRAGGRVLAGAVETLTWFARTPGILQTVLTGNLRANAELKLGTFGLAELIDFDIVGYGCDHRVRSRLVGVARQRAAGRAFTGRTTVLIGDTIRDVQAARDNDVRVVAVATGETGAAERRRAGADIVLSDLTDPPAVLAAVRGSSISDLTYRGRTMALTLAIDVGATKNALGVVDGAGRVVRRTRLATRRVAPPIRRGPWSRRRPENC